MRHSIFRGAAYGLAAWMAYGAVELVLSVGTQLVREPDAIVASWEWRPIAMIFGVYACVGLITGSVAGMLLSKARPADTAGTYATAAVITLIAGFGAHLLHLQQRSGFETLALLAAFVVGSLCLASLFAEPWGKRIHAFTGPFTGPFTVSLLLLTAPWFGRQAFRTEFSTAKRTLLSVLLMGAIGLAAGLKSRLSRGRAASAFRHAVTAALLCGIFVPIAVIRSRPRPFHPEQLAPVRDPAKPNVLLITMDTVRADHLSLFGYERDTTPNLREFARGATVYSRAMATSDFTLPTHASIFTGLYPGYYGPIYTPPDPNPVPLPPGHATLAELTRAQGYFTLELAANYAFLAEGTGLTRGFLQAELKYPAAIAGRVSRFYLGNSAEALLGRWINTADFERPFLSAAEISARAEELIALAAPGRPFFLFLNLMDAHAPYIPQAPFDARFLGSDSRVPDPFSLFGRVNLRGHPASESEKRRLISQYDGGIAAEDDAIGKLVRHLRDRGLYENTLIVITSDHGEEFGEHGFLSHNLGFVYETNLHVPLLIKYPLQMEAKRSDVLVSQVNILPTVLESADIPPPAFLQGRSLAHRQSGESSVVFALSEAPSSAHGNPKLRGSRQTVLEDSRKLIVWTNGPPELYDLALDPGERHNLYQPDDPRAADLSKRLTAWISSMPRPAQRNSHNLDKQTIEKLKSLGYVQ